MILQPKPLLTLSALLWAAVSPAAMSGADVVEAAKAAFQAKQDTVVTLSCVLKLKFSFNGQTQEKEQKFETAATTIDPSGLFVTSAESLEHSAAYKNMAAMNKKVSLSVESEISTLQVLFADGTQADADLVLSDKDLDLSFVRLRAKPATPLPAVALAAAPTPAALDQVFVISRAPKLANRVAMIQLGRIDCVVRGPQPFLLGDGALNGCLGCLVYGADGTPVGIEISKSLSPDEVGENAVNGRDINTSSVIRPVAAMLDLAKQALTAAPSKGAAKSASPTTKGVEIAPVP